MIEWKNTDPRFDINKRATIVIVYPGAGGRMSTLARVDTKETWTIFTDIPEGKSMFGPHDDWDDSWMWSYAPPVTKFAKPKPHPEDQQVADIIDKAVTS